MAGSAGLEIGAFRTKFHRFMIRKWRILADSPDSELSTPQQRIPLFRCTSESKFWPVCRSSKSRVSRIRSGVSMYLGIQVLRGLPELENATSAKPAILGRREIQFLATSVGKFPHFD